MDYKLKVSMKKYIILYLVLINVFAFAQKGSDTKKFELIHTELKLTPIWSNETLKGEAKLTLKPYFYDQNSVVLNAKSFDIKAIKVNNIISEYIYDNFELRINFSKYYTRKDTINISIEYIAKPNTIKTQGSDAISNDKGLYFINSNNQLKDYPRQLWTQGETQANSGWFPTIDTPNQKHKQDIYLTVEPALVTLSNGLLVNSKANTDGSRTDHWKLDKPHSVYLTMIAAGNFKKVIDSTSKDIEVSYYMEPAYEKNAYGIFGRTPEMIKYFENLLGVKYAWPKYAQLPVRKFVSGAMENTTATTHAKTVLKTENQLIDENDDGVIAHELFHHWFGNLVTCESWSQLPLNESFANYSEFLWATHKYGKDEGDYVSFNALSEYLNESETKQEPLIRFNYNDKEDMFDAHSYQKGGRVLHTLRLEVGDDAFFKSLNLYLTQNAFQNAEIENLRMAFEKITGRDLKWFFDQWFMSPGHPRIAAKQEISNKTLKLNIYQTIDSLNFRIYKLKIPAKLYDGDKVTDLILDIKDINTEFSFPISDQFKGIVLNPDGYFMGTILQEKTTKEFSDQYFDSKEMYARFQALLSLDQNRDTETEVPVLQDDITRKTYLAALKDNFWRIRQLAVQKFFDYDGKEFLDVEKALQYIIKYDSNNNVKASAILAMRNFLNPQNDILFREALKSKSYILNSAGLEALLGNKVEDIDELMEPFLNIEDINIFTAVGQYLASKGNSADYDWFVDRINRMENFEIYQSLGIFSMYLTAADLEIKKKAIPLLYDFAKNQQEWYVRAASTQILSLYIDEIPEAKKLLNEVLATEKDNRLINYYQQFNNK